MQHTPYRRQNNCAGAALTCAVLATLLSGCVAGPSTDQPAGTGSAGRAPSPAATTAATQTAQGATKTAQGEPAQAAASPGPPDDGSGEALADTSAKAAAAAAAATQAVKQTVTDSLTKLAAGSPKPATAQVSDALTGAGIAPATLQVSQSRTPTGLEADAIEAAVLAGKDCVIGQVREGAVTVTVLPVLASGKCFVGS